MSTANSRSDPVTRTATRRDDGRPPATSPAAPAGGEGTTTPRRRKPLSPRRRRQDPLASARIAIVHDYLNQMGGAERVLEVLHEVFPAAPIYTSMYAPALVSPAFGKMEVHTSFMQRLPFATRRHQAFLPFYPAAFEQFDLSGYDVVLSMSSAWSKGVVTPPETCHVCYCLTPMRFAWQAHTYAAQERIPPWAGWLLPHLLTWLRTWDVTTAQRVDAFVAISRAVARRVGKYYRRSATVIHPPVDTQRYTPADDHDDYFLVVSRLVPYKRIDLAVQACTELGLPLKVVGSGRDRARLEAVAGPTVEFLGRLPDATIRELMARCRAFLFPGEEDFGLTPLEAQASGRPVVALARGGALETVVDGVTGRLVPEPTVAALATALSSLRDRDFDARTIRRHAVRFDTSLFKRRLRRFVAERWAAHRTDFPAAPRARRRPTPRRRQPAATSSSDPAGASGPQ